MDEYAYMLENADKSEPFRNKLSRRIDPSLVIPAVRVKEVEPEIVEEEVEEVVEDTVDEEIVEAVSTEEVVEDVEVPSNASDDHEIHVYLGRRREAIRNIERQELEAERVERLKQEEADKLNDPVERAKKAVDELKKEISEVEEDTDYDEVVEETVEEVSIDANISETEEDDLQEISRIAGINEEVEEEEERRRRRT